MELTPDCIPTGRRLPVTEWFDGQAFGDTKLDDMFTGTLADANSSTCVLRDPDSQWEVTIHSDGVYASLAGHLPPQVHLISRIRRDAVLYDLPPQQRPNQRGRSRKRSGEWAWNIKDHDRHSLPLTPS